MDTAQLKLQVDMEIASRKTIDISELIADRSGGAILRKISTVLYKAYRRAGTAMNLLEKASIPPARDLFIVPDPVKNQTYIYEPNGG